jgi:galactokinase
VIDALRAALGQPPDTVWRAPGRVNLIGEHTDYNDGFMLPLAIELSLVVAAVRRPDQELRFRSLGRDAADQAWLAYPRGVAEVLRADGVDVPGADVVIASDVPEGAGLSSSAALEVGVALALFALAGDDPEPTRVARLCRRAEEEIVGMPAGIMDQLVAVLGRAGHALLIDARSLETEPILLPLDEADLTLLVVDTAVPHTLRESAYADRRRECEDAARALGVPALRDVSAVDLEAAALDETLARRARHVVSENERVLTAADLLRGGRLHEVGPLLTASHASLRDDYEVSTPELDTAVACALDAGALGARVTGGGFGGSAIALCASERQAAVTYSVAEGFRAAGFGAPRIFSVRPSDGASRIV